MDEQNHDWERFDEGAYRLFAHFMEQEWMIMWFDYLEAGAPFGFKERHVIMWAKYDTLTTTN